NGGNKDWGRYPPYRDFGYEAAKNAAQDFTLGTAGAGIGCLTAGLKGGLGSASTVLPSGHTVSALVAVNAVGGTTVGNRGAFWAAPFEMNGEFGGVPYPHPLPADASAVRLKFRDPQPVEATTIAIIATDAALTKASAKRLAIAAHDGFSRAIWPAHTPMDGDLVFALATGAKPAPVPPEDAIAFYAAAASTMARAIARGVHAATEAAGDLMPSWGRLYGQH
ncbi:P1 family peptidase, partial [Tianweitania sp.]|uniref:P1 family peptidase n=1 Tax=Tianweitania sp. TaxID=2021634 RepID=UPI0028986E04